MSPDRDQHTVRRVLLPSGKEIEVVYFEGQPAGGAAPDPGLCPEGLHVCPDCASATVIPIEWSEAGPAHWEMSLRCPNCEWTGGGIFSQDVVERFEEELDRATALLVRDLQRLAQANMEDDVERFVVALGAGHVWPEDF